MKTVLILRRIEIFDQANLIQYSVPTDTKQLPLGVPQTFQKHNGICYGVQYDICILLLWLLLVFSMNVFSVLSKPSKLLININMKADFSTQTPSLQLFPAKELLQLFNHFVS